MINKIKIMILASCLTLFVSNANAAQKDCSVFSHAFDRNICEKRNLEEANNNSSSVTSSSSSSKISDGSNKVTGFFKNVGSKLKLKSQKKYREKGD